MSERRASPFSRGGVLALVFVGFCAFVALLYFLAIGDTGADKNENGQAHAASNGLNGYSALVKLIEADGHSVTLSRSIGALETSGLLVLTPPASMDPIELTSIIEDREYVGPTLVILPKWNAVSSQFLLQLQLEDPEALKEGWVLLTEMSLPPWAQAEEGMLALGVERGGRSGVKTRSATDTAVLFQGESKAEDVTKNPQKFMTVHPLDELTGSLPTAIGYYSKRDSSRKPLILDQEGRMIAFSYEQASYYEEPADLLSDEYGPSNWVVFVVEPDLMNNWGLSDERRAMAALSLVRNMDWGEYDGVVFDLTINGFGGTMNLLTLAFQPPFLAATICLILAMFIIGWRAFLRFGPSAARARETAFGKAQLVTNGADLIVRAGRLTLLAEPYIALSQRRIARSLGLAKPEPAAIDAALAIRAPGDPSFTDRANTLRAATKPLDILRAARALNEQTQRPSGP
jgi:hypothetical protein